jgi:hypothetical protein
MNFAPTTVSLGGAAIGTLILVLVLQRWWMKGSKGKGGDGEGGGRNVRALIPFTLSTLYGMLAILCGGGLLGTILHIGLWGSSGLGTLGLIYGVGGTSPNVTRAQNVALTPGGYVIVFILTGMIGGAFRWSKKLPKKQVALGILCGISLGLVAGVAGVMAVPLANAANLAGAWWTGAVQ